MADRFPLILNTNANQIQEIASGDTLDLTGNNVSNAGVITATSFSGPVVAGAGVSNITAGIGTYTDLRVGGNTTFSEDLVVTGNARVTGILTVGTSSIILNDSTDTIKVGTALTLGHTQGVQFHTQNLHSAGFEVNQINASGIITATTFKGDGDFVELDVDGHTNLDNVSVAGVSTFTGAIDANGDLDVDGHTNLDNVNVVGVVTVTGAVNASHSTFGNLQTTGINIQNTNATINFIDTNNNPDYRVAADGGTFDVVQWNTGGSDINVVKINTDGHIDIGTNVDFAAGIDVTGNATVSGNLSVGGVLTYEDVTNVDSVGIVTARQGVRLGVDGTSSSNYISVGASNDLKIWHQSSNNHSYIREDGSGSLIVLADDFYVQDTSTNTMISAKEGAEVNLHFNGGTPKLSTTNTGVTISGTASATTFSGSGASLTNLNGSNIASGTVPVARIGTGTKSATTFYRGDGTFATVPAPAITAINNASNNRIVTSNGGTTVNAESDLTYSTYLNLTRSNSDTNFGDNSAPGGVNGIFIGNSQSTNGVFSAITLSANDANGTNQSGSLVAKSVSGGYVPEVHITQRTANNTNESNFKITSGRQVELRYQGATKLYTNASGIEYEKCIVGGSIRTPAESSITYHQSFDPAAIFYPEGSYGNNNSPSTNRQAVIIGTTKGNWVDGNGSASHRSVGIKFSRIVSNSEYIRAGIAHDINSTEKYKFWTSYGDIHFKTRNGNDGNHTWEECDRDPLVMHHNGHVSMCHMPYAKYSPGADSNTYITDSTEHVIDGGSATTENGMSVDTSNGRITVPYTGKYLITANIGLNSSANTFRTRLNLMKNGSDIIRTEHQEGSSTNGGWKDHVISAVIQASANEYFSFDCQGKHDSGTYAVITCQMLHGTLTT